MKKFFFKTHSKSKQYLFSIIITVLVSAICFGLSGFLGYRVVALILLFTVSLLAITFDILPVLLAATLSAFIWNFFFIPPRFTFHVSTTEDTILLIMYFVIAMINAVLTYKIRQIEKNTNFFSIAQRIRLETRKLYQLLTLYPNKNFVASPHTRGALHD